MRVLARVRAGSMMGAVHLFEEANQYLQGVQELAGDDAALRRTADSARAIGAEEWVRV